MRSQIDSANRADQNESLDRVGYALNNEIDSHLSAPAMTKTISFAALHFTVAFLVGWAFTGSWLVGGTLAMVEPACNTVVFHFHEKMWKRIEARRALADSNAMPA